MIRNAEIFSDAMDEAWILQLKKALCGCHYVKKALTEVAAETAKGVKATERQKEIIYLYFWEQMNQQDIAKCLGISQQTVWGTIKRSIEIMKKHLSESEN